LRKYCFSLTSFTMYDQRLRGFTTCAWSSILFSVFRFPVSVLIFYP
jgi:hypothetical protein